MYDGTKLLGIKQVGYSRIFYKTSQLIKRDIKTESVYKILSKLWSWNPWIPICLLKEGYSANA